MLGQDEREASFLASDACHCNGSSLQTQHYQTETVFAYTVESAYHEVQGTWGISSFYPMLVVYILVEADDTREATRQC
jgi:hypothetical protein